MTADHLVRRGEEMHRALGREYYLTGAGHKANADFQSIYAQYDDLTGDEALAAARASGEPALLEWIVDVRVGRVVAPLDERQLAWEQSAVVGMNGDRVPYLRVPILLANEPDRARRIALDAARGAKARELEGIRRDRFAMERETLAALGYPDYVAGVAALSGMDLDALGAACARLLDETEALYRESLARVVRRRLSVPVGELVRADIAWLFRADAFDAAFPGEAVVEVASRQMAEMRLDASREGRVRFDTEEREGKQPRAFCVPVRVPDEVYLVLRPRGGHQDYRTFWHELGHAMHFGQVPPDAPFAARWLGDNSVTEGFAMLWDHLTIEAAWLGRYTGLSREQAGALAFELAVNELYLVRRYAAKIRYELVLHRGTPDAAMKAYYAECLGAATGFRYAEDDFLLDVDPGFYSARYLRAWQLQAAFAEALVERFDEDWYRNPRAGPTVDAWMAFGQAHTAERLAREAAGRTLNFARVVADLERRLA